MQTLHSLPKEITSIPLNLAQYETMAGLYSELGPTYSTCAVSTTRPEELLVWERRSVGSVYWAWTLVLSSAVTYWRTSGRRHLANNGPVNQNLFYINVLEGDLCEYNGRDNPLPLLYDSAFPSEEWLD